MGNQMFNKDIITWEDLSEALSAHYSPPEARKIKQEIRDYIIFKREKMLLNKMGEIVAQLPKWRSKDQEWWDLQQQFDEIQNELNSLRKE